MQLQKRNNIRYLSITISVVRRCCDWLNSHAAQLTPSGVTRPITQEIPIDLKLAEDIALAEPPQLPRPEVNVYLPPIKTLKAIIDKMKAMGCEVMLLWMVVTARSDKLVISANMAGDLVLKIDTTMVVAKTFFHDLHAPKWRLIYLHHSTTADADRRVQGRHCQRSHADQRRRLPRRDHRHPAPGQVSQRQHGQPAERAHECVLCLR